jgi:dUTP pyrophosphatase
MKVKIVDIRSIIPTRKHPSDAGLDLYAVDNVFIPARSQAVVDTGLQLAELPLSSVLLIWPRSGLDANLGVTTGAGVVDYSYRGNIKVLLKNESDQTVNIPYGTAIAQALIQYINLDGVEVVGEVEDTERGATGGIMTEKMKFHGDNVASLIGGSLGYAYQDKKQ